MVEFEEPVYGVVWEFYDDNTRTLFLIIKGDHTSFEVHTYDRDDYGLIFQDSFDTRVQAETYIEEYLKS
jgi:hypothetical protein